MTTTATRPAETESRLLPVSGVARDIGLLVTRALLGVVLIAHGWDDLSCPFMISMLAVDQMPPMGDPSRVAVENYPGGHMFYSRPDSGAALRADVRELFRKSGAM